MDYKYLFINFHNTVSILDIERNRRCSGTISFKKIVESHIALQWSSFLGLKHKKIELVKFLVSE